MLSILYMTAYVEPIHRLDQETVGLLIVAKNPLMKILECLKRIKLHVFIVPM